MWAGLSAADVVRRIYHHLAVDGWSCHAYRFRLQLARHPHLRTGETVAAFRGRRTQGLWRSGHIRNLVVNPVYRGILQYGRRSSRPNGREVISASVSPLVSDDVWNAAIATLKRNRAMPRNSCHSYLLRSLIRCAVCGLSFCGTWARNKPRYRCNGSMAHRGPLQGKCIGASIKGERLEAAVWSDVSRFLTHPSELVDELLAESSDAGACAVAEAERASLLDARNSAQDRRKRAIDLYTRAKLSDTEFDAVAADVEQELKTLDDRLADLEPDQDVADDAVSDDVLAEIRERLRHDLSEAERREIVQLLVRRITVHTTLPDSGRKQVQRRHRLPLPACSPNSHGHRCESQLQSPPHHRRLSPKSLAPDLFQLRQRHLTTAQF